jgi:quercetin dioxygenase-like cupin family protein
MKPAFYEFATARAVPVYDGKVTSHRLVTTRDFGAEHLGLHVAVAEPGVAGREPGHPDRDVIIHVIEGSILIGEGEALRELVAGQGALIPRDCPYDWRAGPKGWRTTIAYHPPME